VNKAAQAIQKQRAEYHEITEELEGMSEEVDRVGKKVDRAYFAAAKNISNGRGAYVDLILENLKQFHSGVSRLTNWMAQSAALEKEAEMEEFDFGKCNFERRKKVENDLRIALEKIQT